MGVGRAQQGNYAEKRSIEVVAPARNGLQQSSICCCCCCSWCCCCCCCYYTAAATTLLLLLPLHCYFCRCYYSDTATAAAAATLLLLELEPPAQLLRGPARADLGSLRLKDMKGT